MHVVENVVGCLGTVLLTLISFEVFWNLSGIAFRIIEELQDGFNRQEFSSQKIVFSDNGLKGEPKTSKSIQKLSFHHL